MVESIEKMRVSDDVLDLMFRKAPTYNAWLPKPNDVTQAYLEANSSQAESSSSVT
jgi:hypothetical protein